ncbi:MAG: hypothetical protein WCR45_04205 [Bacteroidaceae bacterium]|nr:hypothetical protein [Bacteroidaceae bacterium]
MNKVTDFLLRSSRRIWRLFIGNQSYYTPSLKGQAANDFIAEKIRSVDKGLMISKFGTSELNTILCFLYNNRKISLKYLKDYIYGHIELNKKICIQSLCVNAGFFPQDEKLIQQYTDLTLEDIKDIDILGSYQKDEKVFSNALQNCTKIDLDGFYAPFMWNKPWTKELKEKKVLVIHPFIDSIRYQYEHNREKLFNDPNVLPEFKELITLRAVQSIGGNGNPNFKDWFEALKYMQEQMDKQDYDVAIIGCGAYGMPLAAHAKRRGKIAIHLAGWTQMLFGIYGKRWIQDKPQYSKFINQYWIRPSKKETPNSAKDVEGGCYW